MVQLKVLSGKQAGASWVARRFPVRIGRATTSDLRLDDDGVWDKHLVIEFKPAEGYVLGTQGEALAAVNGAPAQQAVLHNGDSITIGGVELQFWLAEARQSSLALREALTWAAIAAVFLSQVALLYWLVK